jgi:hypothetical protein
MRLGTESMARERINAGASLLEKPLKLLAHLSVDEIVELIKMGEKATWPKIEQIRIQTKVSRKLDKILADIDRGYQQLAGDIMRRAS